jgi:RNA polymerase sigma-70 factor (ECF subfamily)
MGAVFEDKNLERIRLVALVRAAQEGNRDAFGELFGRFERTVFAVALRRLGDYGEAEELCQDVFVQALTKIGQLREPACIGGWLRAITVRLAINRRLRRAPAVPTESEDLEVHCVEHTTPFENVVRGEEHARLRAGLKRLRTLDRETLEAFYVRGRSLVEMSDEFEAPVGTIKRRLHVARKRLARQVEPLAV